MQPIQFRILKDPAEIRPYLPDVQILADCEKEALGFLPDQVFEDANTRRRLIVAVADESSGSVFAGHILFSGVFPNAKVQQIAAASAYRLRGAATALMRAFISELERTGHISIRADVASDLPIARAFYERHGFELLREKTGGAARNRTIRVYSKTLESDTLFSAIPRSERLGIEVKAPNTNGVPVFAFDLNVYFDLARNRANSTDAQRLFGEALGHTMRLTVSDEFVSELRRTSKGLPNDLILQLALQLPRLPKPDSDALKRMAEEIHELIFVKPCRKDAGSVQARSDARHVVHAALSKASAFITRDGPILYARRDLLRDYGIDVATVAEVLELIPTDNFGSSSISLRGESFSAIGISPADFDQYCREVSIDRLACDDFCKSDVPGQAISRLALTIGARIVGVGALIVPRSVEPLARMLLHVRHEVRDAESFADYLIETLTRAASNRAASAIELLHISGQSIVNGLAIASGFHRRGGASSYTKIAIGRPLTAANWDSAVQHIRRRTNLVLPSDFSSLGSGVAEVTLPNTTNAAITVDSLEGLLSPTLILWPGRAGVIVPIGRPYADQLLGTSDQPMLGFIANKDAAFLSRRGYVNSPRAAKLMRPGAPIIFYESKRSQRGRGVAVAVARIASSIVVAKAQLEPKSDRRLVIEDAEQFSATADVLLTTFDNLMPFPNPVPRKRLKELNAIGNANLQSAHLLTCEQITAVLTSAWTASNAG